jgi:hypothetical protein
MSILICIPTFGAPYISAEYKRKLKALPLRDIKGTIYGLFNERIVIHPSFREDNTYWDQVGVLLENRNDVEFIVYVNDVSHWCLNVGTIVNPITRGGCPHLHGDVYIAITIKELEKCCIDPCMLQTEGDYDKKHNSEDDYEQ